MAVFADDPFGSSMPFGGGMIRPAGIDDAIEGVMPRVVAEPGTPEAIAGQIERAQALLTSGDRAEVMTGTQETNAWSAVTRGLWAAPGTIVKMSWLQSSLPAVIALVEDLGRSLDSIDLVGRVVVGAGFLRVQAEPEAQVAAIERLRAAGDVVGNVVVLRADSSIKKTVGVFGPTGDAMNLLREIKRAFDPAGILNAGRGIV